MESDHKSTKFKSGYHQGYQSFSTARNTLDGYKDLTLMQKGQMRYVGKDAAIPAKSPE